jgi:hypothetical protein
MPIPGIFPATAAPYVAGPVIIPAEFVGLPAEAGTLTRTHIKSVFLSGNEQNKEAVLKANFY